MGKNKKLLIVESPAKVKTIKKFLGSTYEVAASQGHIRDLPKSTLGIDPENDYEPKYITIRGKGPILSDLKKEVKKADKVYLATDPDREGEAISWHLAKSLGIADEDVERITFNEITKDAVKESLKHPRKIDINLVDAQQSRRMLDRIVGYKISPILWAKVKRGLSAGRVQSAALRIICDREDEINAFVPEEYWSLDAEFKVSGEKKPLIAKFYGNKDGKIEIKTKEEAEAIKKKVEAGNPVVDSIKTSERTKKAPLPFTTSTLQQEAAKQLNSATKKTMQTAQQLYEGVDIKGRGTVGIITYLRTDSTRISDTAKEHTAAYISEKYGSEYVGGTVATKTNGNAQDAHEAIRPTDVTLTPELIKESLTRDQFRLYQLIWKRFVASQMAAAKYENTTVKIAAGEYIYSVSASKLLFDGFLSVYKSEEDKEDGNTLINGVNKDSELGLIQVLPEQHFTQPPAHFTEASLVKNLEELGIGRPSTYAPTISTLLLRRYIVKEQKNLYVTEIGTAVNNMLKSAFPTVVDVNFTANMESLLDCVADGSIEWKQVIRNFYPDLEMAVEKAEKELETVKIEDEVTDIICDKCGRNMVVKYGPSGKFLGCPGFPECRNTMPYLEKIGVDCPKCGKDIVIRRTKKGRIFYGCEGYPECDFSSWQRPSKKKCPKCGGLMIEKGKKLVCADIECGHVEDNTEA